MNMNKCMNYTGWPKITFVHNPIWLASDRGCQCCERLIGCWRVIANIHKCMNNTGWPKLTFIHKPKWLASDGDCQGCERLLG